MKRPGRKPVRIGRRLPRRVDFAGSVAGVEYSYKDSANDARSQIVLVRPGRKHSVQAEGAEGLKESHVVSSPAIDRGWLYWLVFNSETSSVPDFGSSFYYEIIRRPIPARRRRQSLVNTLSVDPGRIAVDRGQIFYTADTADPARAGVYRVDGPLASFR